jgi:hypothetical protein
MAIGQATCEARIAVNCSMQGDLIDWAIPVVYARDPNMTMRIKPDTVSPMPTAVPGTNRRVVVNTYHYPDVCNLALSRPRCCSITLGNDVGHAGLATIFLLCLRI